MFQPAHKARLRAGTPTNSAVSLQKQKQLPTGDSQSKVTQNMQSKPSNVSEKLTRRQKETTAFAQLLRTQNPYPSTYFFTPL